MKEKNHWNFYELYDSLLHGKSINYSSNTILFESVIFQFLFFDVIDSPL